MLYYYARSRILLKQRLIVSRQVYCLGTGLFPRCPICGFAIRDAMDLHEALITRGGTAGISHWETIFTPVNCVLRHRVCPDGKHYHTAGHGADETFERCARDIVRWDGYDAVRGWLDEMRQLVPQAAQKAILRLEVLGLILTRDS